MTPREALDRIAALCNDADETNGGLRGWVLAGRVRAVLAEVSPAGVGGVLVRDQAIAVQLDRRDPREAAAAIATQILGRQRTGPLDDEELGRFLADSVIAATSPEREVTPDAVKLDAVRAAVLEARRRAPHSFEYLVGEVQAILDDTVHGQGSA